MKTMHFAGAVRPAAMEIVNALAPHCEKIELAGSLRRRNNEVGDVEIVALPKNTRPRLAFGDKPYATYFDKALDELVAANKLRRLNNGSKYVKFEIVAGFVQLDLFVVRGAAQWGVIYAIRTGPADFSHWLVTPKAKGGGLPDGYQVESGALWKDGMLIPTPEEKDFFEACGLAWKEPQDRQPYWRRG